MRKAVAAGVDQAADTNAIASMCICADLAPVSTHLCRSNADKAPKTAASCKPLVMTCLSPAGWSAACVAGLHAVAHVLVFDTELPSPSALLLLQVLLLLVHTKCGPASWSLNI